MHIDVVELEQFYKSRLGLLVQRTLRNRVRELWPSVGPDAVLGLGFPNPIMARYARAAMRAVIAQPAQQGADWWDAGGGNATALTFEDELPFADGTFDRVIALHLLENTDSLAGTLQEIWRVLAPEGRFIVIVPNRRSFWARLDRTPFGHGRPFSRSQIVSALNQYGFNVERHKQALYYPPSRARLMVRIADPWEKFQSRLIGQMGGVHVIELVKRVEGLVPSKGLRVHVRLPRGRPALQPALQRGRAPISKS
jgi:SAM-dependent methyltransferase